ncbi:L,D-transpeptidase family protein [Thalassotalea litorea]|uniref:L,D-transpeptidase family protein n=1 Tax=Thalassotalea litorea TaxID=2020715 RepID=UPI0037367649
MPRFFYLLLLLLFPSLTFAQIDLVKVDKSENRMYLLWQGEIVRQYHIALGENPKGHKQQEGDERTPEGRYLLDYKKEDSSFYRAMHISYPNAEDLANARENQVSAGGLIMIHGQKNGMEKLAPITQQYNWTDGCIALTNDEMDEFMALVDVGTPIEIEW